MATAEIMILLPPSANGDEWPDNWVGKLSDWEKRCGLKEKEKAERLRKICGSNSKLVHSLQDKFFEKFAIEQIMGSKAMIRVKNFLRTLAAQDINKALDRWQEFERRTLEEALGAPPGPGKGTPVLFAARGSTPVLLYSCHVSGKRTISAKAMHVAVPGRNGVFFIKGRKYKPAEGIVKRKKTRKNLKKTQKIDLETELTELNINDPNQDE